MSKLILDLCGGTGSWSRPYGDAGYEVINVTLPDHDVLTYKPPEGVYGILAAPPCTKFSKADWRTPKEERNFGEAIEVVSACLNIIWAVQAKGCPLKFWALENPMGYLYNFLGFPYYYFQPWQFGEIGMLATKRTALWGYFKKPRRTVLKRTIPFIKEKKNHDWYGASAEKRAITPPGFAKAFFGANK